MSNFYKNMNRKALSLVLSVLIFLPTVAFAKDDCEKTMMGTYYTIPYSDPSGIHGVAIELLSDDPMNGKPNFYVEKRNGRLVHVGATSGNVFEISDISTEDKNLFNQIAGNGTTKCGYEVHRGDIKVFYVDLKKAGRSEVKELYDYFMEIWGRFGRVADESRFLTKVSPRKMTLEEFTNTRYFLYQEYSDGTIGIGLLVPLEKK